MGSWFVLFAMSFHNTRNRIIIHASKTVPKVPTMIRPNTSSPSYAPVARRQKVYRGGFRSSICDLFLDPSRGADCCALACCGILQSDKNRFLLNAERPVWWKRLVINIGIPLATLTIMIVVGALLIDKDSQSAYYFWALLMFLLIVTAICIRGRRIRMSLRREIMQRIREEHGGDSDENAVLYRRTLEETDIRSSQATCCGCYWNDVAYTLAEPDEEVEAVPQPDFCTRIFQNLSSLCCGACCQRWCQCCGMCAIGQEEREISAMVPKHLQLIDYMTFEVSIISME